ncbi:phenylacetic acid degradation protein [Nocardioides marmoriginsengisoli]|uniref:Phenylacetic acid degradation protein n=1 Tax=Nocardioides marmoriginsengisoli TaxID=661483 RepID=A0A3N0CP07_9ACTN|nr:2Fe-2S iron-sulfur cluster-binding protein [Nocardioides marmoriginsengisoli]RNL65059.1 phenylacetic acid degradation protein [Nocardioides marmoriginsengisoli]
MRPDFHPLRIAALDELTEDAVAVTFEVPDDLRDVFAHQAGQHVAIRVPGERERRSYSICTPPGGALRIGVRRLPGGAFSDRVLPGLRPGDELEVLTPTGRFGAGLAGLRRPAFVAAGSGITPILAMVAAALADPAVELVSLVDCNRSQREVMFLDEIADLKNRWPDRLQVVHVLTREAQESPLLSSRLDPERLGVLRSTVLGECDGWFLCGPFDLVTTLAAALVADGVPSTAVHTELFHAEAAPTVTTAGAASPAAAVVVRLGGLESRFTLEPGEAVLDGLLRVRADAPYACQGGVCGTCRARLFDGEVTMAATWALEPDELARGDVLTCQARPTSGQLALDFDV